MSKNVLIRENDKQYFPINTIKYRIKPLKKAHLTCPEPSEDSDHQQKLIFQQAKKYQIKNPKWASFYHDAENDWEYKMLKLLKKCKSLQLTSIIFDGKEVDATVGHFWGDIKDLDRISRHIKKLHFGAGAVRKQGFRDLKTYLLRRKSLTDLLLVPYWFPLSNIGAEDKPDLEQDDENPCRFDGISHLIRSLGPQLEKLGIFGCAKKDFIDSLNLNLMKRLRHFTLKTALCPGDCNLDECNPRECGTKKCDVKECIIKELVVKECDLKELDEFAELHLEFIKKILKAENVNILTLYCEVDSTEKKFWVSLKNLLVNIKRSLVVDVKIDYQDSNIQTNKWFKKIFKDLPQNVKVNYSIGETGYFLSMPQGIEILGEDENEEEDDGCSG